MSNISKTWLLFSFFIFTNGISQIKKSHNTTVNASEFGVVADYKKGKGTDNTKNLQKAIDFCSKNKKTLLLPKGKILLNSYGTELHDTVHGNILNLRSNLKIIGNKSELIIGSFFHNKNFIVLSGFNAVNPIDFYKIENIKISSIAVNFNARNSYMEDKYYLRKGIELGHVINAEISNCIFKNGDLSCALATGYGDKRLSKNILIFNNNFINLIQTQKNVDHTSIYINSSNSKIYNNIFYNNSVYGKLVACATEFHNSDCDFSNNNISGYTRMMFIACIPIENRNIKNIKIFNNRAQITNAGIYLWIEKNCLLNNVQILNNIFKSKHIKGFPKGYNGTQGVLADAKDEKTGTVKNLTIQNNKSFILYTDYFIRAVNFATKYNFTNINNICNGCKNGESYK
ncbi:hypothetical protein V3470_06240 [Flavobacterium oreochromis]|uniref:Right handed beta helix domain-containing protein n=1 Tax=Flavobacterium oreochromis TaxID=2906078 RepID=A0ABW8PAD1_9FLAO|nr:hypothetical protein [Flavobacterium oreochromis]OWP77588.1 hypothetical protein BWG23_04435 [Flavobacterium oreochromis]